LEQAASEQPQLGFVLLQIDEQYWNSELDTLASSFPVAGFPPRTVVICPTVKAFQHGTRRFTRTQFPLMLAAAFTTHKSQSMQFDYTVIEVGNLFAANLLYVAITRNKTLAGMVLVGRRLKKEDFRLHASKLQQIDDECKRVEALQQPTLDVILDIVRQFYPELDNFFNGSFDE
jgi:hypothetical protein